MKAWTEQHRQDARVFLEHLKDVPEEEELAFVAQFLWKRDMRLRSFVGECPKCQEGTHPFYDVEQARWLCDRCHHPAGEPFVHDAEGGEG